jgi:hypothetical protein
LLWFDFDTGEPAHVAHFTTDLLYTCNAQREHTNTKKISIPDMNRWNKRAWTLPL